MKCQCETSVGSKWGTDANFVVYANWVLSIWWAIGFLPTSCVALALVLCCSQVFSPACMRLL